MIETRSTSSLSAATAFADSEAMAALMLHEDAKQSRQTARELRQDAQEERLALSRQAANKLREMASCAAASAVWQGAAGLASAACAAAASAVQSYRAAGLPEDGVQNNLKLSAAIWDASAKAAGATAQVDPAHLRSQYAAVEKQELEAHAEVAAGRVEEQRDVESEARRLAESAAQLLQKANDARQAAAMAALRG